MVDDLGKLSVGELKKQLFWLGASVPSGHIEKSDLVAALKAARLDRERHKSTEPPSKQQQRQQKQQQQGVLRPEPRPLDYDVKHSTEAKEVVDLHLLSEEELRRRVEEAGGTIPEDQGQVGKFYLVTLLRNLLRNPPPPKSADESGTCGQGEQITEAVAAPPPPPPEARPEGASIGQGGTVPHAPSAACSQPQEPFDDRDPVELSASELKRRLRAYGAYGEMKLRGLSEKPEFVAVLREAIAERGRPPQPAKPRSSNPQAKAAVAPKVLNEAAVVAQMQELHELEETLAEGDLNAAAAVGEAACQEAEAVDKAGNEVEEVTDGPSAPPHQNRQERRSAARTSTVVADGGAALEVKGAVKRRSQPLPCARKVGNAQQSGSSGRLW